MSSFTLSDWLVIGMFASGTAVVGFQAVNRWAVANHRDRLAMITSACANGAGQIHQALRALPPDVDVPAVRSALIAEKARAILAEFDTTGPAASATVEKVAGIVEGQLGLLPAPVPGPGPVVNVPAPAPQVAPAPAPAASALEDPVDSLLALATRLPQSVPIPATAARTS